MRAEILALKGLISEMSPEEQAKVFEARKQLEDVIAAAGNVGLIALALVGMEKSL